MRRILLCAFALILMFGPAAFAQYTGDGTKAIGEPDAGEIGRDSSQQRLKDITVDLFEDPGSWYGEMPTDYGLISIRRKEGFPLRREQLDADRIAAEKEANSPLGRFVLGVKVIFYRRAVIDFSVLPARPLPVPGIVKTVSVWVVGRSFNHKLKLVLEDYFGERHEVYFNRSLTFKGWDKLTAVVPPSLLQSEKHFTGKAGLKIVGLKVECDLLETYGTFYMYLDDLSAITDLFSEEARDPDDVLDDW